LGIQIFEFRTLSSRNFSSWIFFGSVAPHNLTCVLDRVGERTGLDLEWNSHSIFYCRWSRWRWYRHSSKFRRVVGFRLVGFPNLFDAVGSPQSSLLCRGNERTGLPESVLGTPTVSRGQWSRTGSSESRQVLEFRRVGSSVGSSCVRSRRLDSPQCSLLCRARA
jgi:hypothetical protein